MISMNMRPPRLRAARKLARTPLVKARILKSWSRNIGCGTVVSMKQKATRSSDADGRARPSTTRVGPPHHVAAVGLDAVGDADHDRGSARGRR